MYKAWIQRLVKGTLAILLLAAAPLADAAHVEISAHAGQAFPFYEQSFTYDPGSAVISIPGLSNVNIQQNGAFRLDGKGGSSVGAGLTFYLAPHAGIELRVDSAAIDLRPSTATYHVSVDLPAPLPDISRDFRFPQGTIDVDRLQPFSLNLKLRTPGRLAVFVSGGISYLPHVNVTARQRLGLGIAGLQPTTAELSVGSLVFNASVESDDMKVGNRIGGNVGGGLRLHMVGPLVVFGEARYFHFPKHTIEWSAEIEGPLTVFEQTLVTEVERRLQPIEFYPAFFQATAGVALAF